MFLCSKKKSFFPFALLQDFYVGGHADGQGFILRGPVQALPGGNIGKSPNADFAETDGVAGGGLEFLQHVDAVLCNFGGDFFFRALLITGGEGERQAQRDKERAIRIDSAFDAGLQAGFILRAVR